jgi:hypothetical protein
LQRYKITENSVALVVEEPILYTKVWMTNSPVVEMLQGTYDALIPQNTLRLRSGLHMREWQVLANIKRLRHGQY